jgi:acetylornithine deacetylase/succinyl-diaminopimelate desuccinylase-like protein
METIKSYVQQHKDRFVSELIELLKIPSVSANPAYHQDIIKTANAVKASLEKAGCDFVEICDTPGNPIVYGIKTIDKNLPTVLVYGHYDVQPADPIDLWTSPHSNPLSKKRIFIPKAPFLPVVLATTKAKCTCT